MAIKSYKALVRESKSRDGFWIESVKHDFAFGLHRQLKRRGITNAEFARKLDVSPSYVSKVMRGEENFGIDMMVKLARAADAKLHLQIADQSDAVRWFQIISSKQTGQETNATAFVKAQEALKAA